MATHWGWGYNFDGQAAGTDSVSGDPSSPVEMVGIYTWKKVATGALHCLAIKHDGSLWAWGANTTGALGDGTTFPSLEPVLVSTGPWIDCSAGYLSSSAIKSDGSLWSWGSNTYGQLGRAINNSTSSLVPVREYLNSNLWKMVSVGNYNVCAIRTDGTLWCWGANNNGQLGRNNTTTSLAVTSVIDRESSPVSTWTTCSVGDDHVAAIRTDGSLYCWGMNTFAQCGRNNTTSPVIVPTREYLNSSLWSSVSAGGAFTCAIRTNGAIYCWGKNANGQLGRNSTTAVNTIVQESLGSTLWRSVSAGSTHVVATRTDNTLWTWGADNYGQLGNGAITGNKLLPTKVPLTAARKWINAEAGADSTHALEVATFTWGNQF